MRRVWDPDKDEINRKKHGVSFEEASELFDGRDYFEIFDVEHSIDEDRFIGIGVVSGRLLFVCYTEPAEDLIRIISARRAEKDEIAMYRSYVDGLPR